VLAPIYQVTPAAQPDLSITTTKYTEKVAAMGRSYRKLGSRRFFWGGMAWMASNHRCPVMVPILADALEVIRNVMAGSGMVGESASASNEAPYHHAITIIMAKASNPTDW